MQTPKINRKHQDQLNKIEVDEVSKNEFVSPFIFVLGDSRTGTLSLTNYFLMHGIKAKHYFIDEANTAMPLHNYYDENKVKVLDYIRTSGYIAFSDYPTRHFYKELLSEFPDAYFILTVRGSTHRWTESMRSFFSKFDQDYNYQELANLYENVNADIRSVCLEKKVKFLEICIDDDPVINAASLANFLGLPQGTLIPHDNQTTSFNNSILSQRGHLFSIHQKNVIENLEKQVAPSKSIMSEYGWAYLINDTNDFFRVQFGERSWSVDEIKKSNATIQNRVAYLKAQGAIYRKFIVPEKSIIYREFLPKAMASLVMTDARPAEIMAKNNPEVVCYLGPYLADAKSYGQLYFRGDTHTNWLGSWFVYRFIADNLDRFGLTLHQKPFDFCELIPSIASYDGDLYVQTEPNLRKEFEKYWGCTSGKSGLEVVTQLQLSSELKCAVRVDVPLDYQEWFTTRETLIFERADKQGLKAVIFRDSTIDFCVDYLAQHFSRSVFIWHQGLVYLEVIEREKPDIVLHIMAERFVFSYNVFTSISTITPALESNENE